MKVLLVKVSRIPNWEHILLYLAFSGIKGSLRWPLLSGMPGSLSAITHPWPCLLLGKPLPGLRGLVQWAEDSQRLLIFSSAPQSSVHWAFIKHSDASESAQWSSMIEIYATGKIMGTGQHHLSVSRLNVTNKSQTSWLLGLCTQPYHGHFYC